MIYEDVYQFLMRQASSKEFDIILNLILHSDWNSNVRIDLDDLAKKSGTTKRYVKDVMQKFQSAQKNKFVIKRNSHDQYCPFTMNIGKSSLFYSKGDNYCKKFSYLYSKTFQPLSIYEKRIMLAIGKMVSKTNQTSVFLKVSDFIYRDELSSGLIPSRKTLISSISNLNQTFNNKLKVSLVSSTLTKTELIQVNLSEDMIENTENNFTERFYLRKTLFEHGFANVLEDEYCIEIEKTAKYIFNSFIKKAKKLNISGLVDQLMFIARDIYTTSLKKLANNLNSLVQDIADPKEVSAYFSAVVFSVVAEEMAKYKHQEQTVSSLYNSLAVNEGYEEIQKRIELLNSISSILEEFETEWIMSRAKTNAERKTDQEQAIEANENLREYIATFLTPIESLVGEWGNKAIALADRINPMKTFRQQIVDFLTVHTDRLKNQTVVLPQF